MSDVDKPYLFLFEICPFLLIVDHETLKGVWVAHVGEFDVRCLLVSPRNSLALSDSSGALIWQKCEV